MQKILENLHVIKNKMGANVYVLGDERDFVLVDTGIFVPNETKAIVEELEHKHFRLKKLRMILLTHCHCDHIGGAQELAMRSGAKIAVHAADIPFILQEKVVPEPYASMMVQEQDFMRKFNNVIRHVDIALADGDMVGAFGGLRVIQVPGHTPGSIALYQPKQKIMFFGDVIRNHKRNGLVIGVPEKFNCSTPQIREDAKKLLQFPIDCALFGHGEPLTEHADESLCAVGK